MEEGERAVIIRLNKLMTTNLPATHEEEMISQSLQVLTYWHEVGQFLLEVYSADQDVWQHHPILYPGC